MPRSLLVLLWLPLMLAGMHVLSLDAVAQVPQVLHYQATLAEGGFPAEGPLDVEAAFYADSTGGSPIAGWSTTRSGVPVNEGRFDLYLGRETSIPDAVLEESTLFLELTVNGERLPRIRVTSTAFALRARRAESVAPGSITSDSFVDGAVTGSALAGESVTTEALAKPSVTTAALTDGAVTRAKLASAAVSTGTILDGAVTNRKLGSGSVDSRTLTNGAVTTSSIANGSVTRQKVSPGAVLTSLNGLTDGVRLVGGENVSISSSSALGTITISASEIDDSQPSSRRWKTDIRPLNGLRIVQELRGVRYRWKESGVADVGLIAEEVGQVVPEVVTYADDGKTAESVNYGKLVSVLIEAVKSQQAQIEAERARLRALEQRLDSLESALSTP